MPRGAITVAVACSMAGIIAGCITVTGLASILINAIVQLAGNATIVGLVLTMLCCIVLGMGVPTTANYCIMASTCAPILIQLGFPLVAAHFFVFYFGIVADITPPVALAAYAGAAIAKSDPMKTGINATKLAIAAFIVPYIFAYSPALLFENISGWWEVAQICISALLGIFGIAAALNGFLYKKIHPAAAYRPGHRRPGHDDPRHAHRRGRPGAGGGGRRLPEDQRQEARRPRDDGLTPFEAKASPHTVRGCFFTLCSYISTHFA